MRLSALAWAMGAQYAAFFIQFVLSLYLARHYIAPTDLGLFSACLAASGIVIAFQDFGLTRYLVGLPRLPKSQMRGGFSLSVALTAVVFCICLALALHGQDLLGLAKGGPVLVILGTAALFTPLSLVPNVVLQRRFAFKTLALIETASLLVSAGATLLLAIKGLGAEALAWGSFVQQAGRALFLQWAIKGALFCPFQFRGSGAMLRFGQASTLMNAAWMAANRLPDLAMSHQLGAAGLGFYSRAFGVCATFRALSSAAASAAFYAAFSSARARGTPLAPLYERMTAGYCALTWPGLGALALLADPIVNLLFGSKWLPAADALRWIALSEMCFVALPLHAELPLLVGRIRQMVARGLADSVLYSALLLYGVGHGLAAVAAMRCVFGGLWLLIHGPQMRAVVAFEWGRMARVYALSAMATLAALLPAALALLLIAPAQLNIGALALIAGAGVGLWLIALLALRHPVGEAIRSVARRTAWRQLRI